MACLPARYPEVASLVVTNRSSWATPSAIAPRTARPIPSSLR